MLRWHSKTCRQPDVYPAGDIPFCAYCDRTAPSRVDAGPSETPYYVGKPHRSLLNLTWPSSVQYVDECVLDDTGNDLAGDLIRSLNLESDNPNSSTSLSAPSRSTTGFQPLTARDEIRVLHLQPGEWDDPLHGTLEHADIQREAKFEAVSYSWANEKRDTSRTRPLFIGPSWDVLSITLNCEGALRRLRHRKKVRRLWVDAVCINQANPSEQSHQVGLMDHIYSNAKRCLVYLGEHSGGSRAAMEYLRNVYDHTEFPDTATQVISELFARRYFSRLWILQEIVLARDVHVHCGDSVVRWDLALWNVRTHFPKADVPVWVKDFELLRMNGPADFPRFLFQTSSSSTSDPRDRIFALFGLLNGVEKEGLSADYALSFEQVYTGVAAYLLKQRLSLILYCCSADKELGLPSWVPDWRCVEPEHWDLAGPETFPASITARDLHTDLESKFPPVYLSARCFHQALAGIQNTVNNDIAVHTFTGGLLITIPVMIRLSGFSRHESYDNVLTRDIPDSVGKTIIISSTTQLSKNDYLVALGDGDVFLLLRDCLAPRSYKVIGYCLLSMSIPPGVDKRPGFDITEWIRLCANALFGEYSSRRQDEIAMELEQWWMEDVQGQGRVWWYRKLDSAARQTLSSTTCIQHIPYPLKPKAETESASGGGGNDILAAVTSGLQLGSPPDLETTDTRSYISLRLWKDEYRCGLVRAIAADTRGLRLTNNSFRLSDTLRQSIETFNSYLRTPQDPPLDFLRTPAVEAYVICTEQQTALSDLLKMIARFPTSINYNTVESKVLENIAHVLWTILDEMNDVESESVDLFEDVIGTVFQQLRQVQAKILEMLGQLWMCKLSSGTKTVVHDELWQPAIRAAAIALEGTRGQKKLPMWYFRAPAYLNVLWAFDHLRYKMVKNHKAIIL